MLPTKFQFIWPSGFRGEDCFISANQKQELPVMAMFANGSGQTEQSLYRTFHRCFLSNSKNQNPVHLAERFQRRLKCEKVADDSDGKISHCLWQGELKTTYNAPLRMVD